MILKQILLREAQSLTNPKDRVRALIDLEKISAFKNSRAKKGGRVNPYK